VSADYKQKTVDAKFGTFFATEVFMGGIIRSTFTRTATKKESESAAKAGISADVKVDIPFIKPDPVKVDIPFIEEEDKEKIEKEKKARELKVKDIT